MPPYPTLPGFLVFIRNQMGISTTILPDSDPVILMAYEVAREMVNCAIRQVSCLIYTLAVYNLAGSNVIEFAHDQPGAPTIPGSDPPAPFFAYYRRLWNVNDFVSGVVQSSNDNGTGQSMVIQEAMNNVTLADLQYLKTPYGRTYLGYAQQYGGIVGVT